MQEDLKSYGPLRRYLKERVRVFLGYPVHNFMIDPRDDRTVMACITRNGKPARVFFGYYEDIVKDAETFIRERVG